MTEDKTFARTIAGKSVQHRFHKDAIIVWVEGKTDYTFFEPLTRSTSCSIRCAGGRQECAKVARATVRRDLPYVIIIDGDYGILDDIGIDDQRIVMLARYSIENYCAEPELVETVCRLYSGGAVGGASLEARFSHLIQEVEKGLRELVVCDVAVQRDVEGAKRVLPRSIVEILERKYPPKLNMGRIAALREELEESVADERRREAEDLIARFLSKGRFLDVLRGHLVFDLIRWFILGEFRRAGLRATFDDRILRALLAAELWSLQTTEDHAGLRCRVEEGLRDAERARRGWAERVEMG